MDDVVKSPILQGDNSAPKNFKSLGKFLCSTNCIAYVILGILRLRAWGVERTLTAKLSEMVKVEADRPTSLTDIEVKRCAAIIVSAILNPSE